MCEWQSCLRLTRQMNESACPLCGCSAGNLQFIWQPSYTCTHIHTPRSTCVQALQLFYAPVCGLLICSEQLTPLTYLEGSASKQ